MYFIFPLLAASTIWGLSEIFSDISIDNGEDNSDEDALTIHREDLPTGNSRDNILQRKQIERRGKMSGDQV